MSRVIITDRLNSHCAKLVHPIEYNVKNVDGGILLNFTSIGEDWPENGLMQSLCGMSCKFVYSEKAPCHAFDYYKDAECDKCDAYPTVLAPLTFETSINKYGIETTIPESEPIYQIKITNTPTTCEVVVTFGHNIYGTLVFDPMVDVKLTITKQMNSSLHFYHSSTIIDKIERNTCLMRVL